MFAETIHLIEQFGHTDKRGEQIMKKVLIGLVVLIVLVFGGLKIFEITNYGGTTYYTKITNTGQRVTDRDDEGNKYIIYAYDLPGYDEKGGLQQLKFNANQDRPLRKNAYLKVTYNDKKGVTSWESVPRSEVPKAALSKLE